MKLKSVILSTIFASFATAHAHAVPSLMTACDILTGEPIFPSALPSMLAEDSSVVRFYSTTGNAAALNVRCRFQTFPIYNVLARRINFVVRGFSARPINIEGYNRRTGAWNLLRTVNLPNSLTRVTFGFNITSWEMATRFIDPLGQMLVRIRRNDTRQFSLTMDCLGVEVLY